MSNSTSIVGSLPIEHSVDPNGSLSMRVPIRVPPAKLSPDISISYHSAVHQMSVLGHGWDLQAFGLIQRTGATIAQDHVVVNGTVNYDSNDRYTLNGQRLMHVSGNEYRFEIEQWSKIEAIGDDPANPVSWKEYLPNGTVRLYGSTKDSNILAVGQRATRIWALAETYDPFSNYTSYAYAAADGNGFLILDNISYGGNRALTMKHQRKITFSYKDRDDLETEFVGGSPVSLTKRLVSISNLFDGTLLHTHTFDYDYAPVTRFTRLQAVTLSDASGASVSPLKFKWSDSFPSVFDNLVCLDPIAQVVPDAQVFPADVDGSGRTDVILASKQFHNGTEVLCLDVHLADGKGGICTKAQHGSGPTVLPYPDYIRLLALDVNGDGKTDLLHIVKERDNHRLTVLLSTEHGYEPQLEHSTTFAPDVPDGRYYSGDFQGNGNVSLVYLYNVVGGNGSPAVRLVQFISDGRSFLPQPVVHGPSDVDLRNVQVVIADFNGNGAHDIFLISPTLFKSNTVCRIDFFESQLGYLKFRDDNPFSSTGTSIPWTDATVFLALPERDGKTGLLLLSQSRGDLLQFQTLRSTGKSFHVSNLTPTYLLYSGNINLGHSTSPSSLDLVNTFEKSPGSGTEVSVLHFINGEFVEVTKVTQPLEGFAVNFADLRGIGRADCLFTLYDFSSKQLQLRSLPCTGSVEAPADFIVGYTGGLGATLSVSYAPLTDSTVYTASTDDSGAARRYVNALYRTSSSHVAIGSPTQESTSSVMGRTRTQLVHFPKFVVKELTSCALPSAHPEIVSRAEYFYTNGKISFDGRGWLGFETMVQRVLGTATTNTYIQQFPFVGQVLKTEMREISGNPLKNTNYTWSQCASQWTHCYVTLPKIQQTSYENGSPSYSVDVAHDYDSYANITQTTITTAGKPSLVITYTYSNDADRWIIGSKMSESITSDGCLMKRSKSTYLPGTQVVNQMGEWVSESHFSMQDLSFDDAGNVTKAVGPERAQRIFAYDPTYSFPITVTASVNDDSSLTTSASYDFGLGQKTSVTECNGYIKAQRYDVLGRVIEVKEGDSPDSMTVIEKRDYSLVDDHAVCVRETLCDLASKSWSRETEYFDGMGRTWKKAVPCVSDPSVTVFSEVLLDGAGRIVRQYRNYTNKTSKPVYTAYCYDGFSRKTKITSPPATSVGDQVEITYHYSYSNHQATFKQTKSGGGQGTTVTQTTLEYFPNTDSTSAQFVVPLTVSSSDELGRIITTSFDALHRAVGVTDPSGVCLSQQFDGLSRQTSRKISNPYGTNPGSITDFSIEYDDGSGQTTITNNCTKVQTVLLKDRLHRLVKRTTSDELVCFRYDDAPARAQGRLFSVTSSTSSNSVSESFLYDKRGCLQKSILTIDDQTFTTSFEYNGGRQLSKVTTDGSVLTKTFFHNSNTVKQVQLRDADSTTTVSSTFSDFDNPFCTPLVCDMGNGLKSRVTIADNGVPVNAVLSKGDTTLHQQKWELNGYGRLDAYQSSSEDTNCIFEYDLGGQLVRSQSVGDAQSSAYSYDRSGNILSKDGNSYLNQGWQLTSITDSSRNLSRSFEYTEDGHLTLERNGLGQILRTMTYDSAGRMTSVNSTTFVYDFRGRMIKATRDGSVTCYPSEGYEVTVQDSKTTRIAYLVHQNRRASISTVVDSAVGSSQTSVLYYHGDHLGSVVAVSDGDGKVVTTYSYDAYGTPTCNGLNSSRYKYSGKEVFEGLYYFGARFYDPATGRFTTLDNATFSLNDIAPSIFNQYTFSHNNPVNFIEINGNMPFWWHLVWHLTIDIAMMAGGIALGTVGGFLGVPVLAGEAMVGAGLSGLIYDGEAGFNALVNGKEELSDGAWGVALGTGAAFSLTGLGLASGAAKAGFASIEAADVLGTRAAGKWVTSGLTNIAKREAAQLTLSSINGVAQGFAQAVLTNVVMDKNPLDGVDVLTAGMGGLGGLGGGVWSRGGVKALGKAEAKAIWSGDKYFYNVMRDVKSVSKALSTDIRAIDTKGVRLISSRSLDEGLEKHASSSLSNNSLLLSGQSNLF